MLSMCGLLCRFMRGWRQTEAVGTMIKAAIMKDSSLLVEAKSVSSDKETSSFCLFSDVPKHEKSVQILWQDNDKQAKTVHPKEQINLTGWTLFLHNEDIALYSNVNRSKIESSSQELDLPADASPLSNFPPRLSVCSQCESEISVLLEASYRQEDDTSLYGYDIMVESFAHPYAWRTKDLFGVIVLTTPTNLISMIHAFFNNSLFIDQDLTIRKIMTVNLLGEASSLTDSSTALQLVSPEFMLSGCSPSHCYYGIDGTDSLFSSHVVSSSDSLMKGIPSSLSFACSSQRRIGTGCTSIGISPIKRCLSSHAKSGPSCEHEPNPVTTVVEEEEIDSQALELLDEEGKKGSSPEVINILVYTSTNIQYYESVKNTLSHILDRDRYVIYNLTEEMVLRSPWKSTTRLLVVCGDVSTHVSADFIRFLLGGGNIVSICSDFLSVAVPLFEFELPWTDSLLSAGSVEVQEAGVVSMNYKQWKNVQLLHHKHCLHNSPKRAKNKIVEEEAFNKGSAVSVEPTHVEITDEDNIKHRLDLFVLTRDNTWKFPTVITASVSGGQGKAIFSQVHLEEDATKSIAYKLTEHQLENMNKWRLDILRDLLKCFFEMHVTLDDNFEAENDQIIYTPAHILGEHESKLKFFEERSRCPPQSNSSCPLRLSFIPRLSQNPFPPSIDHLPIVLGGYSRTFSSVKYFENLRTKEIGRLLIHSEVLSSTMDVIKTSPPLGHGVVVIANRQTRGKGRGGNTWLSLVGSFLMSFQLHFPLSSNLGQCLPFLQHLVALSFVKGVKSIPGYEDLPLALKWPNDIYWSNLVKLGGILVEVSTNKGVAIANIGSGINLSNQKPTSCINDVVREYNNSTGASLPLIQAEVLCANTFNQMELLLEQFQAGAFQDVINEYYLHWLHGGSQVTVQDKSGESIVATITGIDQYGFLLASSDCGQVLVLHPDGNSFNMLEGLISVKLPAN